MKRPEPTKVIKKRILKEVNEWSTNKFENSNKLSISLTDIELDKFGYKL